MKGGDLKTLLQMAPRLLVATLLIAGGLMLVNDAAAQRPRVGSSRRSNASASGPDLSIGRLVVTRLSGRQASLGIFLRKRGQGQVEDDVTINWVQGSQRDRLWRGRGRFMGTRDGFQLQRTVTLPRNTQTGRLEVTVGSRSRDRQFGNNVKTISFKNKSDLGFSGRPTINQRVGGRPNREFSIPVHNSGGIALNGCKIEFKVTERGATRTINKSVPRLGPGKKTKVKVPYHYVDSRNPRHNKIEASIKCGNKDIVPANNGHRSKLK